MKSQGKIIYDCLLDLSYPEYLFEELTLPILQALKRVPTDNEIRHMQIAVINAYYGCVEDEKTTGQI